MTTVTYELGRSGKSPCLTCSAIEDLFRIGETLPPGDYWITVTEQFTHATDDAPSILETEDWGTLHVRGPRDWTLKSLDGMEAGPDYVIG